MRKRNATYTIVNLWLRKLWMNSKNLVQIYSWNFHIIITIHKSLRLRYGPLLQLSINIVCIELCSFHLFPYFYLGYWSETQSWKKIIIIMILLIIYNSTMTWLFWFKYRYTSFRIFERHLCWLLSKLRKAKNSGWMKTTRLYMYI